MPSAKNWRGREPTSCDGETDESAVASGRARSLPPAEERRRNLALGHAARVWSAAERRWSWAFSAGVVYRVSGTERVAVGCARRRATYGKRVHSQSHHVSGAESCPPTCRSTRHACSEKLEARQRCRGTMTSCRIRSRASADISCYRRRTAYRFCRKNREEGCTRLQLSAPATWCDFKYVLCPWVARLRAQPTATLSEPLRGTRHCASGAEPSSAPE
jgi:hypothetical protein